MKFNPKGLFLGKKEKIEDLENVIGTNGRLRRTLALMVLTKNAFYTLWVFVIFIFITMLSGSGKGINLFGVQIPPVAASSLTTITTVALVIINSLLQNINHVVTFYFNLKEEDEHKNKVPTMEEAKDMLKDVEDKLKTKMEDNK